MPSFFVDFYSIFDFANFDFFPFPFLQQFSVNHSVHFVYYDGHSFEHGPGNRIVTVYM